MMASCMARSASALVVAAGLFIAPSLWAEEGVKLVQVVEEWELTLAAPDANTTAPQVTCAFAPLGHLESLHATFELNHLATPGFAPGGLHLHAWNGDQRLGARHQGGEVVLRTAGETIRWKQVLKLEDGAIVFQIQDGQSTTWGAFGGGDSLRISVPTQLESLNGYSPVVSVEQSGVGFAGNRVNRLALKKVTATTSTGQVVEDNTLRVAHEQ